MTEATGESTGKKGSSRQQRIMAGLFLGGIIVACVFLVLHWEYMVRFQKYGYVGLLIMTVITGFSIPLPVPYMVFTFTLGGLLNPALVGATAGLGLGIGGTLLYLTGRGGRHFLPQFSITGSEDENYSSRFSRFLRKIRIPKMMDFAQRRGTLAIFVLSVVPNPVFAPVAVSMGAMRFGMGKFFVSCWAGSTAKAMVLAYCGYLGLGSALRWLGVFGVS
ncbi:MAG: VTT domain-containing protein [Dehalococcoidales bacterium]|jgi:membrane protein DedA with SNARE-associated domain|nr:VTT domain-containing protein [Dehalococcoidales bacterium]